MLIEQALMTQLKATAGLTSLVNERIYFVKAPQNVKNPYLVIQKISAVQAHTHDGNANLSEARIQLSAFADTYKEVKDINAQIKSALDNFIGTMGGTGGVYVGSCFLDNETDLSENDLFYSPVDYLITYSE